jgi:hypothetical protein
MVSLKMTVKSKYVGIKTTNVLAIHKLYALLVALSVYIGVHNNKKVTETRQAMYI